MMETSASAGAPAAPLRRSRARHILAACLLLAGVAAIEAQSPGGAGIKSSIVPERFLRGYDPVTVFYDRPVGPARGGPADGPGGYLRIVPAVPVGAAGAVPVGAADAVASLRSAAASGWAAGAAPGDAVPGEYRWLDDRTLQFLPAVPWPALRDFSVQAADRTVKLVTLLVPPVAIEPAPGSTGLEPIGSFLLRFPSLLDAGVLARLVRIEVRDLPGFSTAGAWTIAAPDLTVRELESSRSPEGAAYQVALKSPIPYGKRAVLSLQLSLEPAMSDSVAAYTFQTRPEFRLLAFGADSVRLPVTAAGAVYSQEQALDCGTDSAVLFLDFSEEIQPVPLEALKRLVRFEPAVRVLRHDVSGNRLLLRFETDRDRPYRFTVQHQELRSVSGRPLTRFAPASFWFFCRQSEPFLVWRAAQGIAERFGPQRLPMEGRAMGRVDLRVHRIDPESLNFWPFPGQPIAIDEGSRPPMPGEEPEYGRDVARQIRLAGSPDLSRLLSLPIGEASGRSVFGLDLGPELAGRFGRGSAGTYLVGTRTLSASALRHYVRLTVTDLALSTVEEENAVLFLVTSLRTGAPVPGAEVRVDARRADGMHALIEGRTDAEGRFRYLHRQAFGEPPARIVVSREGDTLVLDTRDPPPAFAANHWSRGGASWLEWLAAAPRERRHERRTRAWLLTERPVYRPEEAVHILGWVRDLQDGRIIRWAGGAKLEVAVTGPGGKQWRFPAEPAGTGRVYVTFAEKDLPTGEYSAALRVAPEGPAFASVRFRKESYRVPLFEVNLSGPDRVPLDRPFELTLTADYYAGGRVVGEAVEWEVVPAPYSIANPAYPGFLFSTDERFSGAGGSVDSVLPGALRRTDTLDGNGSARLRLNPAAERDGRARRYLVRATVRGADRQTVTTAKPVFALPPFSVGLRTGRFLTGALEIRPQIVVLDHAESPLAGLPLTVRLSRREWHSYIADTDFTTGEARYVTDVLDRPVAERSLVSTAGVLTPAFPVKEGGVYLVEVSARDQLGRLLRVASDLFVAGDNPVTWERRKESLFEASPDRVSYQPGMTANILLKSPFQEGFALVVVERPEENEYGWVPIRGGQGIYPVRISETMAPGVPVTILLERGRVETGAGEGPDLGRPATVGASTWLKVQPVANQVQVSIEHAAKQQPATKLRVRLRVTDWQGRPVDGEAALWLVDKAVLALGTEAPLDPLSPFIETPRSAVRLRDSRNLVFGNLPVEEVPGGDGSEESALARELFDRVTVRRNFQTVPYFNPAIPVRGGEAEVEVSLPDNLTDFALRAVAVAGYGRFGAARSVVSVRLPVIVQPLLPRFVRPGDLFQAGGIGRVVEGPGGPGVAAVTVEGLELEGARKGQASRELALDPKQAGRILFPLRAPEALQAGDGAPVAVSLAVERKGDGARDAFRIELPVRFDADPERLTARGRLEVAALAVPEPPEPFRPGSVTRTLIVARDPRLLAVAEGLGYLGGYPHGCLEQRVSRLYPAVLLRELLAALELPAGLRPGGGAGLERSLPDLLAFMATCQSEDGLFGYWPGSTGYVGFTAYVVQFLLDCREAGAEVDRRMLETALSALTRALRSDDPHLLTGFSGHERVEALASLEAAGRFDEGYANDLLAGAEGLSLYSQARLYALLHHRGLHVSPRAAALGRRLLAGVVARREGDREVFAGLQERRGPRGDLVLSSEVRTVAALIEALSALEAGSPKVGLLADDLVARSGERGWGNTRDNVAAMRAVRLLLTTRPAGGAEAGATLEVITPAGRKRLSTGGRPLAVFRLEGAGPLSVSAAGGAEPRRPLYLIAHTDYVPVRRGSQVQARNAGFAVSRELIAVGPDGEAVERFRAAAGQAIGLPLDTVVEQHVAVVNFEERHFAAVSVPLACGFEPLNPHLAGAPKEATPAGALTLAPTFALYADDRVVFYYDSLPKGTFHFFFRARASFSGVFSEPPAEAELLYDPAVRGRSDGAEMRIGPGREP